MPRTQSCSARLCFNKSSGPEKVKFHLFPSDEKICRIWLQRAGNDELVLLPADFLTKYRFLCSKHFQPSCFKPGSSCLKSGSVPSIFSPNISPLRNEAVAEYPLKKKTSAEKKPGNILQGQPLLQKTLHEANITNVKVETATTSAAVSAAIPAGTPRSVTSSDEDCGNQITFGTDAREVQSSGFAQNEGRKVRKKRSCCARLCTSNDDNNSGRFTFPSCKHVVDEIVCIDDNNFERCLKWVQRSGNSSLLKMDISLLHSKFFLCGEHFDRDQFSTDMRRRLKFNAVPAIFECDPLSDSDIENYSQNFHNKYFSQRIPNQSNEFDDKMEKLDWKHCEICKETRLCFEPGDPKCFHGSKCKDFSTDNDMDPGPVPEELSDLTFIEEQLIARIHPIISVFKLKGLQMGYSGNIINFYQDVHSFAKTLPHNINDLSSVIAVKRESFDGSDHFFHVRSSKIFEALLWLKANNIYYRDIEISYDNLRLLPENGNVYNQVMTLNVVEDQPSGTTASDESDSTNNARIHESYLPNISIHNADQQVQSSVFSWPTLSSEPVNEFSTAGYIACAFPALFPTGKGDLRSPRLKKINVSQYFRHLLNYCDRRFAQHPTFRYFCFNSWMRWSAIVDGNIFIKKHHELAEMTVSVLKNHLAQDPSLIKQLMFQASNLRGTKAYWLARLMDLISMVEQLGLPTVFITLSSADFHWPDLYRLLTDKDVSTITEQERRQLIQANPLIADEFFSKRVDTLFETVLKKIFKLTDYWYRIEYQARGSAHIHGICWFEDCPDVSKLSSAMEGFTVIVVEYFNQIIHATIPDPNCGHPNIHPCRKKLNQVTDEEEDISQLLLNVQKHTRCSTNYCLKTDKKTGTLKCKFRFPMEMRETATIIFDDSGKAEFLPARNDGYLNKCNKTVLKHWRANMDFAAVTCIKLLLQYLTKYISKCEVKSTSFKDLLAKILDDKEDDDLVKKSICSLFLHTCAERDYSAQEVCHILSGQKLYSAGNRNFVRCTLSGTDEWVRVSNNSEQHRNKLKGRNNAEKYVDRPKELENVTLFEALRSYSMSTWTKKRRRNIVRIFPKLHLGHSDDIDEAFYKQKVLLHNNWRRESDFQKTGSTWKQFYVQLQNCEKDNVTVPEDLPEESDSEDLEENNHGLQEEWMVLSQLAPHKKVPPVELGLRQVDQEYNWLEDTAKYDTVGSFQDFQNFIATQKQKASISTTRQDLPLVEFSPQQSQIIKQMDAQISCLKGNPDSSVTLPKRTIIQGKAGCGKSLVIRYLTSTLDRDFAQKIYIILAPTGVAAVNVNGETLHSILKIPMKRANFKDLTGEAAKKFCNLFSNIDFLIIDEFSMIGLNMLGMIDLRCRQAKGCSQPFGGLFLYILGDIRQLPPVKDYPLYSKFHDGDLVQRGKAALSSFEKVFVLDQSFRQKDKNFEALLDRLSSGTISLADYNILKSRFSCVNTVQNNNFEGIVHLYSTQEEVSHYNYEKLKALRSSEGRPVPIVRIEARHNCRAALHGSTEDADGLIPILYLAKECRVMLKRNLWTSKGLVNGSTGTVKDILHYSIGADSDYVPEIVLCQFDSYTGPGIGSENLVPIARESKSWTNTHGNSCTRVTFPLTVCYAISIHKSQGLTLEKAHINIGEKEFALGLAYVALSRVKSMDGLFLTPFCFDRLSRIGNNEAMKLRSIFEEDLRNYETPRRVIQATAGSSEKRRCDDFERSPKKPKQLHNK